MNNGRECEARLYAGRTVNFNERELKVIKLKRTFLRKLYNTNAWLLVALGNQLMKIGFAGNKTEEATVNGTGVMWVREECGGVTGETILTPTRGIHAVVKIMDRELSWPEIGKESERIPEETHITLDDLMSAVGNVQGDGAIVENEGVRFAEVQQELRHMVEIERIRAEIVGIRTLAVYFCIGLGIVIFLTLCELCSRLYIKRKFQAEHER